MMTKFGRKYITSFNTFVFVCFSGIASFFFFALLRGAYAFDWISIRNMGGLHFIDYFNHVLFAAYPDRIYEIAPVMWGNFPPFAYLLYRFAFLIAAPGENVPTDANELLNENYYLPLFLYYSIIVAIILTYAIRLWNDDGRYLRIVVCLLFSVPFFAGGVERGNSIVLVMALLMIAMKWKDSESRIKKELALILIAMSTGFKIYPAVMGFLYLKEHRFKEAARLVIYGIVVIFAPFLLFGGQDAIAYWIAQIMATSTVTDHLGRMEYIKGIVYTIGYLIYGTPNKYLVSVIPSLFLIIMLIFAFVSNNEYRTVFFLCCIMAFYPVNSHRYTLCYFAIPLMMFLQKKGNDPVKGLFSWSETLLFSFLFSIPTLWGAVTDFQLKFSKISDYLTNVELWIYIMAYTLMFVFIVHEIRDIVILKEYNPNLKKQLVKVR